MPRQLPLPPLELATRVGSIAGENPLDQYEATGATLRSSIDEVLPSDWRWDGRRALDFGCGAGRVMRHFAAEADVAEVWGCDIDVPSIEWLSANLCPPFHVFTVTEAPQLRQPDEFFDLVWAMSVFTHLTGTWAGWLLELHRVLRPGGYLVASFMGASMARTLVGEEWRETEVGMNVLRAGRSWDEGGPDVFHSEWWLREHWGRAFEIVTLADGAGWVASHGRVVLRKKPVHVTVAELVQAAPGDPRELSAARHNIDQLNAEDRRVRERMAIMEGRLREAESTLARRWLARARSRIESRRSHTTPRSGSDR